MMFDNLRISLKLQVMVAVAIVGILAVAAVGLWNLRDNLLEDRMAKVREVVLVARETIDIDHQAAIKAGLSETEAMERARNIVHRLRFGNDDYVFAADSHGLIVAHPNPKVEGQDLENSQDSDGVYFIREMGRQASNGGGFTAYHFPRIGGGAPLPKISYSVRYDPYDWTVAAGVYIDDIDAIFWSQAERIGVIILVVLGMVVAGSILLSRSVARPLGVITGAMRRLADGDKAISTPYGARRDEIGRLAQSLDVFRDNALRLDAADEERRSSEARADEERRRAALRIADAFEARVKAVVEAVSAGSTDLRGMAETMRATAEETSRRASVVAGASEQASSNVNTVATASEELSASVSEIARQVEHASGIAQRAVGETRKTDEMIKALAEAATKIGEVVQLINDIASQTNLLALNATIEAARAGEAGKGFAVVASEVKALANQTGKATEEIAGQVTAIQSETSAAVAAMRGIGGTIGEINEVSGSIASAVEEQGAATREITRNTQEAAQGTGQVSANIATVNDSAGKTGMLAGQVLTKANDLGSQAEKLRNEVEQFLRGIRAA
jgi:methyl-accepting chemotaxis protein